MTDNQDNFVTIKIHKDVDAKLKRLIVKDSYARSTKVGVINWLVSEKLNEGEQHATATDEYSGLPDA